MAEFMQQDTGEKYHGKKNLRHSRAAGQDEEERLDLAVQPPLEKNEHRQRNQ